MSGRVKLGVAAIALLLLALLAGRKLVTPAPQVKATAEAPGRAPTGGTRPPRFTVTEAMLSDHTTCAAELIRVRAARDQDAPTTITADHQRFAQMPLSPRNQRVLEPIVERILAGFVP